MPCLRREFFPVLVFLLIFSLFPLPTTALAKSYEGELLLQNAAAGNVHLSTVKVRYQYSTMFHEPLKKFHMLWTSPDPDATLGNIHFRARVDTGVPRDIYAFFEPGYIPEQGEWSGDVSGSPSWDKVFNTKSGGPVDADTAKAVFEGGFRLTELTILDAQVQPGAGKKDRQAAPSKVSVDSGNRNYKSVHGRAGSVLETIYTSTNPDGRDTPVGQLIADIEMAVHGSSGYGWGACPPGMRCIVQHAENVQSPRISGLAYDLGAYTYVFYRIGPLYAKSCSGGGRVSGPVEIAIDATAMLGKTSRHVAGKSTLSPGQVAVFGLRVRRHDPHVRLAGEMRVVPTATGSCNGSQSAKNPFEKSQEAEWRKELAKAKAKNLGAVETKIKKVVLACWDGGRVDGDQVKIRFNKHVLRSNLELQKDKHNFKLTLKRGLNIVEITAVSEGAAPPNTAEFTISGGGKVIKANSWNLQKGQKGLFAILLTK